MKINNFSKAGTAYQVYKQRKSIWKMLKDVRRGKHQLSLFSYLVFALGLIYVFFPADLIPDVFIGLGWVDDGVVLLFLYKQLKKELDKYNEKENTASQQSGWKMIGK